MADPKCPKCEGTELDIKSFTKEINKQYTHQVFVFYCLKCGFIISLKHI